MNVYDSMNELERLRKRMNMSLLIFFSIFLVPFFGYILIVSTSQVAVSFPMFLLPIAIIVVFVCIGIYNKDRKQFRELYKNTFVTKELDKYFTNVNYQWKMGFTTDQVKNFGLSKLGNRFHSEDYLSGTYKDINFEQADVTIQYHSSNGKNSTTVTYFKGRMFSFDFPKNAVVSIQLHSKNFMYAASSPMGFKMHKISLESDQFNKEYKITSVNDHDAFYILTPALMERINAIHRTYNQIVMHFSRGRLYVGLNYCGDCFDPPMTKKLDYPTEQARIKKDIQVIMDIIDTMTQVN